MPSTTHGRFGWWLTSSVLLGCTAGQALHPFGDTDFGGTGLADTGGTGSSEGSADASQGESCATACGSSESSSSAGPTTDTTQTTDPTETDPTSGTVTDTDAGTSTADTSDGVTDSDTAPPAACGDGVVDPGEQCDDGGESAACNTDCSVASCGDAIVNDAAGEACDDAGPSAGCDDDCTLASCGDGNANANAGEDCDDAGQSAQCDPDCTDAACGDGYVNGNAGEECDDGALADGDGCSASCADEPDGGVCVFANGLQWCYNNAACGQACNDVCSALGMSVIASDAVWLAAQDEAAECQAISDALGMVGAIQLNSWSYACLEDSALNDAVNGGLTGGLYCSTYAGCPTDHRTNMDQLGIACGAGARRSICPCE